MATLAKQHRSAIRPFRADGERLFTAADLAIMPETVPSGTAKYELDNGRLVIIPPPDDDHGPAAKTVTAHRRGQRPKVFREIDALTAEDIVPGFRVQVSDVFQL